MPQARPQEAAPHSCVAGQADPGLPQFQALPATGLSLVKRGAYRAEPQLPLP